MAATGTPVEVKEFHGLYTASGVKSKVPWGRSPDCPDMTFAPGRAKTRPGLTTVASSLGGDVMSIKEFVLLDPTVKRTLIFTDAGTLFKEPGTYTYASVATDIVAASVAATTRMNSATLFGREYANFAVNGITPNALPRQYDDTNFDPVAPPGPAGAPTVTEAGVGTVSAGIHKCRVFFKTRSGYWTAPGPAGTVVQSDAISAIDVTGIPTGPAYVVARVLAFTPSCSEDYYFIEGSNMVVNDNTTTSVSAIDFSDTTLISGTIVSSTVDTTDDLLRQITLPAQSGVAAYHRRTAWWGGRNEIVRNGDTGFLNLRFSGGWSSNTPLGWTQKIAGQSRSANPAGAHGDALRITGDGGSQVGCIECSSVASEVIPPGVEIRARVRAKVNTAASGKVNVYICPSATANGTVSGMEVDAALLSSAEWRIIDGQVLTAANNTLGTTHRLRISGSVSSPLGIAKTMDIDYIELYPGDEAVTPSRIWWSKPDDPEAIDGLTGFMNVAENDGQAVITCFELGDNFYPVKERSTYVTRDTGAGEPGDWPINRVSATVGTPSARGVGDGDGWVVIASRQGLMFFAGGAMQSLTDDIKPTWDRINWLYGYKIWVLVDVEAKRVKIGVPLDGGAETSVVLSLDYQGQSTPLGSQDWSIWVFMSSTGENAKCATFSERSDGTRAVLFGDTAARVSKLDSTVFRDNATAPINSYYVTGPLSATPNRQLLDYATLQVNGSGTLDVSSYGPDYSTAVVQESMTLAANPDYDVEIYARDVGERIALKFANAATNQWFSLWGLTAWLKDKPGAKKRGSVTG